MSGPSSLYPGNGNLPLPCVCMCVCVQIAAFVIGRNLSEMSTRSGTVSVYLGCMRKTLWSCFFQLHHLPAWTELFLHLGAQLPRILELKKIIILIHWK